MRHGEAEAKSTSVSDEGRHLTTQGKNQVRRVLELTLAFTDSKVDTLISSPVTRAKETAEIVKEIFDVRFCIHDDVLEPSRTPYEVFQKLSSLDSSSQVLLVTHQPLASAIVASFLKWDGEYFSMPAGSIFGIYIDRISERNLGKLAFLLPPPHVSDFQKTI